MEDFQFKGSEKIRIRYTAYTYDGFGQVTGFAEYDGTAAPEEKILSQYRITYTYDLGGRLLKFEYPKVRGGEVKSLEYTYTDNGKVKEIYAILPAGKNFYAAMHTCLRER